jgi:superfamily II DNA or RNA helicase
MMSCLERLSAMPACRLFQLESDRRVRPDVFASAAQGALVHLAVVHLVFVPDGTPRWFAWGADLAQLNECLGPAEPQRLRCLTARNRVQNVSGVAIELLQGVTQLATLTQQRLERLPPSVGVWSLAAKLALDLVARGRIVPRVQSVATEQHVGCGVSLAIPQDAERFNALVRAFPLAAHAVAMSPGKPKDSAAERHVWSAEALLDQFLNAAADALVRSACVGVRTLTRRKAGWEHRFVAALAGKQPSFAASGFGERTVIDELQRWTRPLLGAQRGEARLCLRLELPNQRDEGAIPHRPMGSTFTLRFLLQAARDASLTVEADVIYRGDPTGLRNVARHPQAAQEALLSGLALAGRLFPHIQASLRESRPTHVMLTAAAAWTFLNDAAPQLIEAGVGVILPSQLTRSGQQRLRMRMRLNSSAQQVGDARAGRVALALPEVLRFQWQAELAGDPLSADELRELAALKAPVVRFRGQWVAIDAAEIVEALRLLEAPAGLLAAHEALALSLGVPAAVPQTSLPVSVTPEGAFADLLLRLRAASTAVEVTTPATLQGTLRPYQQRGLGWLASMAGLGLGACLADDMGLGKTVQLIALLLHRQQAGQLCGPVLLVCPTSVVGNWERELNRFSPSLSLMRHYGTTRARHATIFENLPPASVVLTTYGLLRRDAQLLAAVNWSIAALDEAQNIKTAASRTAQAARALRSEFRVALTGTPVENRLTELWSIFEFLNPRLLGSQAAFRRDYAIPIERHGHLEMAERLKQIVQPFVLRRLKSDRTIIQDLPHKQEMRVVCSLTREQASLYQAALDEAMRRIRETEGIERRGQVLALITALKQICNHPAQYLHESGPLAGRSGKLQRCCQMLEELLSTGDRALVFTQYREMGQRLVNELRRVLGCEVPFLHGGVSRAARDAMVSRFQEDPLAPPVFVLSVKAGGTGLNLTAASHVIHYDRWWNPAVEDQATDRAFRIGQRRNVQVHTLVCAGTIEEKVDRLLEQKRTLAKQVIGAGERWITELADAELQELFSLAADAVIAEDVADAEPLAEARSPARAKRRPRVPA